MPGSFSYNGNTLSAADATTGWSNDMTSFAAGDDFTANRRQGSNLLEFDSNSTGWKYIRYDNSSGIDLTNNDVTFWFYYTAKSEQVLASANSVVFRAYSDATPGSNYSEWDLTGHVTGNLFEPLIASWNRFIVSGSNPTRTGGTGATLTSVRHFEIRFNFNAANTQQGDPDLGFDWLKYGNQIEVTAGTSSSPADFASMDDWDRIGTNPATDPDYGICRKKDIFIDLWSGVSIGDGSTATYFASENEFIFNNQFSEDCQHDWVVKSPATLRLGILDETGTEDYSINGCIMAVRENPIDGESVTPLADFTVNSGATLLAYATKFYRWDTIDIDGDADIRDCDFDSNNSILLNNSSIEIRNTKFHDPSGSGYIGEIQTAPQTLENVRIFNCVRGFHFKASMTVVGYMATDNTYDIVGDNSLTITLVNSEFDKDKILQV